MAYLFPGSIFPALDNNGNPLAGAKMYIYLAETTTPTSSWTSDEATTPNTNPVIADAAGRFSPVYLDPDVPVRVKVTSAAGDYICYDVDHVAPGLPDTAALLSMLAGTGGAALIGTSTGETVEERLERNAYGLGLFTELAATPPVVDSAEKQVWTTGHSVAGLGIARYIHDSNVDLAYTQDFPNSSFLVDDGRGFRLDPEYGYTPERFGARGDGATNDADAFNEISELITAEGGGKISLRPGATYIVGKQTLNGSESGWSYRWDPHKVLQFEGCTASVVVEGNGATIKCADNLKFGAFLADGTATTANHTTGGTPDIATPYLGMIYCNECSGGVSITNIRLDGNIQNANIGGGWGDTGWQIPNTGIWLNHCTGPRFLRDIETYHHGLDGWTVADEITTEFDRIPGTAINVDAHHNTRQGLSIVGGSGWTFIGCKFNYTGKDLDQFSAPGAGCDIEGEGGNLCSNLLFLNCEFLCNKGVGLVADQGNSRNNRFHNCLFVGDAGYAAWPSNYGYRFYDCKFVGAVVQAAPSADPELACQFRRCTFTDDTDESPTGTVYIGTGPIVDLGGTGGQNVLFKECAFRLVGSARLPFTSTSIYVDCEMEQDSSSECFPRGLWSGISHITSSGTVNYRGIVDGDLVLNGTNIKRRVFTVSPGSIAAGAQGYADITITPLSFGAGISDFSLVMSVKNWTSVASNVSISWAPISNGDVRVYFTNHNGGGVDLSDIELWVRLVNVNTNV